MNKKIPMGKRIGAIVLCLSMLCGVIVGAGVFPLGTMNAQADAGANVEKFEADFAELAALVGTEQWDATTNRYLPAQTDAAIQNWVNARFGLYMNREQSSYKPVAFLGQKSFAISDFEYQGSDNWGGEYWWEITKDGGLYNSTTNVGGQMLRKNNALALKYADGDLIQISNFEANIVFNKPVNELGAVWLSFHAVNPGRMGTNTNNGTNNCDGTVAMIGNGPLEWVAGDPSTVPEATYKKAVKDGITFGTLNGKDDRTMDTHFANDLELGADYNLYVKVVGKQMTVKVTKVSDGAVIYSGETNIAEGSGYISVGVANSKRVLKKIQVTELDADGNPVNIGIARGFKWTTAGKTGYDATTGKHTYNTEDPADDQNWYNFVGENEGKADTTKIIGALNANFDIYYNCEADHYQMKAGEKEAFSGQTENYGHFQGVYKNVWLQRPVGNPRGNQNMRLITSLVPKVNGKALIYQNFETSFKVRFDNADTAFAFGFRQQTPGKFTDGYFQVNKEQGIVVVTKTGITVSGGDDIYSGQANHVSLPGDMYDGDATATFGEELNTAGGVYVITVKAVGDQVTVKIARDDNGSVVYEDTHTVNYTAAGYLAYGVANRNGDLGDISLTHLDADGNKMVTTDVTAAEKPYHAEVWKLSAVNVPGATYTNGTYDATGNARNFVRFDEFTDTAALDYISSKVAFFYNHEGSHYGEVPAYGNAGGNAESGNWLFFQNHWLQRANAKGTGERLRQINAIVPKDGNGMQAQMTNFATSFDFRFENGNNGTGGPSTLVFGFRQKNPAKFVNGFGNPNQEQVIVAITQKSIGVAGGTDITKDRFYHYNQFADDDFGDVFSADLPQTITVKIEAVGKNISVKIYAVGGASALYSGTFTTDYTQEGYMAFGVAATSGNYGELMVKRLNDDGVATDFTDDAYYTPTFPDGKTRFYMDFAALSKKVDTFVGGYYVPTADDTEINKWMSSKFNMYGVREAHLYSELAYLGQLSSAWDQEADGKAAQWKISQEGGLYMNLAGSHGEMLRKSQNLVPKMADGTLAKLKNFEAEVVFNKGGAHSFGAMYISFRETTPGKFGFSYLGGPMDEVVDGVVVGNGDATKYGTAARDGITAGNVKTQDARSMRTPFAEDLDNSADYKLWVKVVGTKLDWSITKVGEDTALATGTETIADTKAGYISIGARNRMFKSVIITELDRDGEVVDFGSYGVGYNPNNTTIYNFDSAEELNDFESWYLPSTNGTNIPAIHTEGTTDDNWIVQDGKLVYKANSMNANATQMANGVTFPQYNNFTYKDDRGWQSYASNHAIAMLKTRTFKNFILDVDVRVNGRWAPIGFGAQDYTDPNGVHATSANGGYTFHVETGSNSTGNAKMWNYFADKGVSEMHSITGITGYSSTEFNHYKIVVSDGVAMLYVNYSADPVITYNLPASYNGGYIYLTLNLANNAYDNLQIVDLDAEPIVATEMVTKVQDITINREADESLSGLPRTVTIADAQGFEYDIAATWLSDDYRSWKEGTSTFVLDSTKAWHNFDLSALAATITVTNNIGNDHNTATTRKYYFDHENDLLDFYQQESKHGYEYKGKYEPDYHSMYSGVLVRNDDLFKIANGKVTNKWAATGMESGWSELQSMRGVATAILKDVNFYNFRLEYDFTHSGMWYTYGIVGVQDPLSAHKQADWSEEDFTDVNEDGSRQWKNADISRTWRTGLGGGVWLHSEQEGFHNIYGDHSGSYLRNVVDANGGDIKANYDKTVPHHVIITVQDGLLSYEVDGVLLTSYTAINETSLGGLVGFGNHRHGATLDNFELTALDEAGDPLDWADAVEGEHKGYAPEPIPDNYLGWKPKDDFVWGDEYEN